MNTLLGCVGVADLDGVPVHVQVVGETDAGRLLVQRVGRQEPVAVIERGWFVAELSIAPEPLSDEVRVAALDLSQAIERAKAMAGTDHLLDQQDFQTIHDELDETDQYPFASALIEHGVHVRTGSARAATIDVMTNPNTEVDGLAKHPDPWASPGGAGEAEGAAVDAPDQPGMFPWTPADAGDGISNEEAHTEHDYPWPRKVEGQADWDTVLLPQIDKAIEEGGGWANMKRLPGGEAAIWDMIDRGILEEEGGFVRRKQPKPEHEAEMGWSGAEMVDERWARGGRIVASVSMMDLAKHPLGRPKHDLEKGSDANSPSGRDRALNPSVHEQAGDAYRDQNQWEDPDMHLGREVRAADRYTTMEHMLQRYPDGNVPVGYGPYDIPPESYMKRIQEDLFSYAGLGLTAEQREWPEREYNRVQQIIREMDERIQERRQKGAGRSMRALIAMEQQPYQTGSPVAEGDGEGVHDEPDLDESTIQPHANRMAAGLRLWGLNKITGIWEVLRSVTPETADQWLAIWKADQATVEKYDNIQVSKNKPRTAADKSIGIAGDAFEDPGAGEPLEANDPDAPPDPHDFGVMASRSMRQFAQGVDNRQMDENVQTNVAEEMNDRAIARPPDAEPIRYDRPAGPA